MGWSELAGAFDEPGERQSLYRSMIVAVIAGVVTGILVAKLKGRV